MINIALIEEQITNNVEAANQHLENIKACEHHLTIAPDNFVKKELRKRINMYKRMHQRHILNAHNLYQQLKGEVA
jgi:hypothetical protein